MLPVCAKLAPIQATGQQQYLCKKRPLILFFSIERLLRSYIGAEFFYCHLMSVHEAYGWVL